MVLKAYADVQMVFNVSSDLLTFFIPLPIIWQTKVAFRQKLVLLIIFSIGVFVIVAALTTKIEFWLDIYSPQYMFWYTREASVAIYVANIPCIWPLLREVMPMLWKWSPGISKDKDHAAATTGSGSGMTPRMDRSGFRAFGKLVDSNSGTDSGPKQPVITTNHQQSKHRNENHLLSGIRQETTIEMSVLDKDVEKGEK